MTTQSPAARAGASFQAAMRNGKFHGTICPTTPMGSRRTRLRKLPSRILALPSSARMHACEVAEVVGAVGHVDGGGLADGLAVVHASPPSASRRGVGVDAVGDLEQDVGAAGWAPPPSRRGRPPQAACHRPRPRPPGWPRRSRRDARRWRGCVVSNVAPSEAGTHWPLM